MSQSIEHILDMHGISHIKHLSTHVIQTMLFENTCVIPELCRYSLILIYQIRMWGRGYPISNIIYSLFYTEQSSLEVFCIHWLVVLIIIL